jgi:hypothetical protein
MALTPTGDEVVGAVLDRERCPGFDGVPKLLKLGVKIDPFVELQLLAFLVLFDVAIQLVGLEDFDDGGF